MATPGVVSLVDASGRLAALAARASALVYTAPPMPNCDFYAMGDDVVRVLDFVFQQPDWELVELASRNDQKLRTFRSTSEVVAAFPDESRPAYLQLYSPEMGGRIRKRRITFNEGAVPGASFRYDSEGWGLIQVYFGRLHDGQLSHCHTNHNSERRARKWEGHAGALGPVDAWDWKAIARVSSRLNRFIRGCAVTKFHERPVLPAAAEAHQQGSVELALN